MTFRIKLLTAAALLAFPVGVAAQSANPQDAQPTPSGPVADQPVDSETGVTTAPPASTPVPQTAPVTEPPAETAPPTEATPPVAAPTEQAAPAEQATETLPPAGDLTTTAPTAQTAPPATTAPAAQPAQTTAQAHTPVAAGPVSVATAADLQAGVQVLDANGGVVGTVESADADSAVVSTGTIRAEIPLRSFGKNNRGLVISMTRAQLEAAAQAPSAS